MPLQQLRVPLEPILSCLKYQGTMGHKEIIYEKDTMCKLSKLGDKNLRYA